MPTPTEPTAMSEELAKALEPFAACVFNDNGDITTSFNTLKHEHLEAAYFALKKYRLRARPGVVEVAVELVLWLLGEGESFECPPEQFFRGKPAPYFWRKRLREAVAGQIAQQPGTGGR